jgi:hypothetical protein
MNNKDNNSPFTIDLLRGQGIPQQRKLSGIVISVISAALPVLIVIAIFGFSSHNKIAISRMKAELTELESKTSALSDALEFQQAMDKEKSYQTLCLSEIKTTIDKFKQWSPVLATMVENMPDSVILTELAVKQETVTKKVPRKDNPKEMVEINVPVTFMSLKMYSDSLSNNDEAIREFRDYLYTSPSLGSKLDKVSVSKESGILENQNVAFYLMNCTFKSGT